VNALALVEGAGFIGGGALVIRYRRPIARGGIKNRVDKLDRSSFFDPDRIDEQKRAWTSPESLRLSMYGLLGIGGFLVLTGIAAIVAGLIAP
jgi:hypothetical protein